MLDRILIYKYNLFKYRRISIKYHKISYIMSYMIRDNLDITKNLLSISSFSYFDVVSS